MDEFLDMDNAEIRRWLDREWKLTLDRFEPSGSEQVDAQTNEIHDFVNSSVVSIRYALVTQVLGRIADSRRSTTALQLGAPGEGAWDARSFSTAVVVPWVADNQHVLGTSSEPYASKPLRRTRLTADMPNVQRKEEWRKLHKYLTYVESLSESELVNQFRFILMALARRLANQSFTYSIPMRASLSQVERIVEVFLSKPSGGLRPMVVAAALLATLGEAFSLFSRVISQGVNESDAAAGVPGDIMCYSNEDKLILAVEVKDMELTLGHVKSASRKAKQSAEGLTSLLFAVHGVSEQDENKIAEFVQQDWASGLNIYTANIRTLVSTSFVLLDEEWRVRFLRQVGSELDCRKDQAARMAWRDSLLAIDNGAS